MRTRTKKDDGRLRDHHGRILRFCPGCPPPGLKRIDQFGEDPSRADGRSMYCRRCLQHRRALTEGRALDKAERKNLEYRATLTSATAVDAFDRRERRLELGKLGRDGVREIRARIAAARAAKAAYGGLVPDEALDAALAPVDCYRTRQRLEGGAG
jgi:hypothetical protein